MSSFPVLTTHKMKKYQLPFILTFCCLIGLSCGSGDRISGLVEVKGTVTYKGAPLDGATVSFAPTAFEPGTRASVALTEPDGTFVLLTQGQRGILPGNYDVTVVKRTIPKVSEAIRSSEDLEAYMEKHGRAPPVAREEIKDLVPKKYGDAATSGLSYSVKKGMPPIEIELKD